MKTVYLAMLPAAAVLALSFAGRAQDKGEEVSQGFRAFVVKEPRYPADDIRNREGKMQDLVTEHGLNPVLAVFSRAIPADESHPLAAVVKKLDDLAESKEYRTKRLGTFLVFLALKNEFRKDETRDARLKEIAQFVSGVMPKRTTIALAEATETPDDGAQPLVPAQVSAMGIAAEDDIVIVFYNNLKVVKRWKFKASAPPGEEELKAIDSEVARVLGATKK
jgi:hypothetical protein